MIVPSRRLLLGTLVVLVPAAAAAGLPSSSVWMAAVVIGLFTSVALLDAFVSVGMLASLEVVLPKSEHAVVHRPLKLRVRCQHAARRTLSLRLALEADEGLELSSESLDIELRPKLPFSGSTSLLPRRRGTHAIRALWLELASNLGLWSLRERRACECSIAVYPDLAREQRTVASVFAYRTVPGTHRFPPLGKGREFDRLREYVAGDAHEHIHWKATAKRGRPITKLFQVERSQHVLIAVDASRLSLREVTAEGHDQVSERLLERYVRSALVLAGAAQRFNDVFGLVVFSDGIDRFVRPGTGAAQLRACREALLDVSAKPVSADYGALFSFVRQELRRRALLVVLTSADDPAIADDLAAGAALLSGEHLLLFVTVGSGAVAPVLTRPITTLPQAYEHLAGHFVWRKRRDLSRTLQRLRAELLAPELSGLTPGIVQHYLSIKRRQLL